MHHWLVFFDHNTAEPVHHRPQNLIVCHTTILKPQVPTWIWGKERGKDR